MGILLELATCSIAWISGVVRGLITISGKCLGKIPKSFEYVHRTCCASEMKSVPTMFSKSVYIALFNCNFCTKSLESQWVWAHMQSKYVCLKTVHWKYNHLSLGRNYWSPQICRNRTKNGKCSNYCDRNLVSKIQHKYKEQLGSLANREVCVTFLGDWSEIYKTTYRIHNCNFPLVSDIWCDQCSGLDSCTVSDICNNWNLNRVRYSSTFPLGLQEDHGEKSPILNTRTTCSREIPWYV